MMKLSFALHSFITCALLLLTLGTGKALAYEANTDYPSPLLMSSTNLTTSTNVVSVPLNQYMGSGVRYCRFFVADAKTREPLYDLTSSFSIADASKAKLFQKTEYGYIEFTRWAFTRTSQPINLTLPEGKAWSDIMVVVLKKEVGGSSKTDEQNKAKEKGIQGDIIDNSDLAMTSDPTTWDDYKVYTINNPRVIAEHQIFMPYEGVVSAKGDFEVNKTNGAKRQHTHTWSYDYYVAPGSTISLDAPLPNGGDWIDYNVYWRWYDNATYHASSRIANDATHGNLLSEKYVDADGNSEGLFYATGSTADHKATLTDFASVLYTAPSDASWTGDAIAADASRYTDGLGYDGTTIGFREPTLSTRFIWRIHPNTEIAAGIKSSILNGKAYEDHGNITIALKNVGSTAYSSLRLTLRTVSQYWFYPYRMTSYGKAPTELDFNSTLVQAKSVSWAVHVRNGNKLYYKYLGNGSRFSQSVYYDLKAQDVIGTYINVSDPNDTWKIDTLTTGREYAIVVYANSQTSSSSSNLTSPIAQFSCYFITAVEPQIMSNVITHRLIDRLEKNYTRVGLINFDDEEGMTFEAPGQIYKEGATNNNSWHRPLAWDKSYYGFVYPQLSAAGKTNIGYGNFGKFAAFHGDYTLVKQAGGTVASNGSDGYRWWYGGNPVLHDRTYDLTNGARSGYFLYVDASDEARPIASLDFEANLCSGSTLILSAAVADLTSGDELPQLIFRLYGVKTDADGNEVARQLIQSFASGAFRAHGATEKAKWYQVFAKTFIHPNASAENYSQFSVTIDNACKSTSGADYAIDDIRFYVANDQVEVLQQADVEDLCEKKNNGAYLKLRMDYSMLRTFLKASERRKPFYYRICTADGTPVNNASLQYPNDEDHKHYEECVDANGVKYGKIWMEPTDEGNQGFLESDVYGYPRFVVANCFFALDPTKEYYISGALPIETVNPDGTFSYEPAFWGNPGTPCSMYSKILNIRQQDFVVTSGNGSAVSKFYAECGSENVDITLSAQLSIPDAVYGGRKYIDWKFDWFVGGENIFQGLVEDGTLEAIHHFRVEYPDAVRLDFDLWSALDDVEENYPKYGSTYPKGSFTISDCATLSMAISSSVDVFTDDVGMLFLVGSNQMNRVIRMPSQGSVHSHIYFIPYEGEYTDPETGQKYKICPDPIKGELELSHISPQLYLGFPTVTYPDDYDNSAKYIRLGLKQANELKKGTLLSIPIHSYRDAELNEGADRHNLAIEEDNGANMAYPCKVRLVSTNDPTVPEEYIAKFGKIGEGVVTRYHDGQAAEVIPDDHIITPESQTISIDFSQNTEKYSDGSSVTNDITFHEGYDYQFVITYHDATKTIGDDSEGAKAICYAYTFFTLRIIPEYVTWTGAVPTNTNWNNDLNWRRSSRAELNLPYSRELTAVKDEAGNPASTAGGAASTSDMAEHYAEYGSEKEPSVQQAPGSNPSDTPQAFVPMKFTKVTILPGTSFPYLGSYEVDSRQGIITNLQNPNLSEGTSLIAYDLMVKTEKESGHNTYACERFYANTCDQVYFRTDKTDLPQGEGQIRNQHYLAYNQAWVDFSIHPNQWNMLASPLHSVYAGDLYLPKATGQQNTEAFQPITFNEADNGRAAYPVYQCNWAQTESRVIRSANEWYDAQVPYETPEDSIEVIKSQWSHAFNDVEKAYLPGRGFSVLPLRSEDSAADTESALFRLPKADSTYDYYDYQGNRPSEGPASKPLDRTLAGLLATNKSRSDDPRKLNGSLSVPASELGLREGYMLVGNPYMGTLEMSSFFNDNPALYRKYWTLDEAGTLHAYGGTDDELGRVAPMRSFFVKSKAGSNPTEIRFLASQCTTVFYATGQTAATDYNVHLSVSNAEGKRAVATLVADPAAQDEFVETEDVETLFDSNLTSKGIPQLYTIAGNRAASINHVSDLRNVALGVSTPEDEDVELRLTGVNALPAPLYLYDAQTRTTTPVLEGEPLTIRTNAPGRYLLTSKALTPSSEVKTALRCYPVQQGKVVASTEPSDRLTSIMVYDTLGRLKQEIHPSEAVQQFSLPKEVYLITLTSEAVPEGRTFKVVVR